MAELNTYLTFDGTCAEAMRFYERTLGGKLRSLITFADSPMRDQVPPGAANRVMHARLELDNRVLMASDAMPGHPYNGMSGFSLTWVSPTAAEAQRLFDTLADGGKVTMPLQKTFWADAFGMLVDRFGTPWMINGGETQA